MDKPIADNNQFQDNYYDIFDIMFTSSSKQIIIAYRNKIRKFNNLKNLTKKDVNEIKLLKVGLYILINPELRYKYNKIIGIDNKYDDTHMHITNNAHAANNMRTATNEPIADNENINDNLDSLFNVDNTWMKSNEPTKETTSRKGKNESNMLGDRIFSLSTFNKRPGFSSDFESELRKPQQGRIDKSDIKNL